MAFSKYARATIVKPNIPLDAWQEKHQKSSLFCRKTARVALQEYDPKNFMLSHATIIASVDTEESGLPLGKAMVNRFEVDRRFSDWLITPKTSRYKNNNHDSWERRLLLATFRTFIGGESYVEHIQIPELSKGKIIDAAARDIGDSIYVDILIANDRRHKPLISAIQNRQLSTLSMGCSVAYTQCTRCGNVAEDETQLCPCVKFFKGQNYRDSQGIERVTAELCGHYTDPASVKFIEASWVANPAFTGAVLRGILSADDIAGIDRKIQVAFSQGPRVSDPSTALLKAARLRMAGFGDEEENPSQVE